MAKREPLIPPTAGPSSTLARIISKDRQDSGRSAFFAPATSETQAESSVSDAALNSSQPSQEPPSPEVHSESRSHENNIIDFGSGDQLTSARFQETPKKPKPIAAKTNRREEIEALAKSPLVPITMRLPGAINDWLDEFAFVHRKDGLRKQDLIAEGLTLLILKRELER